MRKRLVTKIVSSVVAGSLALSLCMGGNVVKGNGFTLLFGIREATIKEANKLTDVDDVVYEVNKKEIKKMQLQGMCRGKDQTFYMFKISDKKEVTTSALYSYQIGEKIKLVNKEVALTGHANDAAYVNKSFKSNEITGINNTFNQEFNNRIYVVTSNKGKNAPEIVSINPDSKNMKKYLVYIDGTHRAVSQIAYYGIKVVDGEKVPQFIIKLQSYEKNNEMQDTNNLYVGYLSTKCNNDAYDGRFVAEKQFKIDKDVINKVVDKKKYSCPLGGMYYKDGTLYVAAAKKDKNQNEFVNESFIFPYKLEYDNLTECVNNKTEKRKVITASEAITLKHEDLNQGNDKFEIEGIHVTDDRIYFTTNNIDKSNKSMKDAMYYIKR